MIDSISLVLPRIAALGISTAALAKLVGLSEAHLRGILNGQRSSSREQALRIDSVVTSLESLKSSVAPLPIDLRQVEPIQQILDRVRAGELKFVAVECEIFGSGKVEAGVQAKGSDQ